MTTMTQSMPRGGPAGAQAPPKKPKGAYQILHTVKLYLVLFLLMAPTLIGMLIFTYYPQFGTVKHAFYRWDGQMREDFVGWRNFVQVLTADAIFWPTFTLVLILFAANAVKMWPSIFTAIVLHRIRSEKWQYRYRVLFVVPMIIPGLVWLLIWKSFYEPQIGPLNKFLNATGLMGALRWMDYTMPGVADHLSGAREALVDRAVGSVWALGLIGIMLVSATRGVRGVVRNWMWWLVLFAAAFGLWSGQPALGLWAVAVVAVGEVVTRAGGETGRDWMKRAGAAGIVVAVAFVLLTKVWTATTHAFDSPSPAWLAHEKLVIPAVIFWGFPWVGTIGVLIYLAGLQNITQDVYEAAQIDGVTSWGKLWQIELPLMMTQVRINLIFLTIGTLTDFGLFLLLLGPEGGPGNIGMVPGLYMYRRAFIEGEFGYACALGMILFVIILFITIFYQKYVKVEK